MKNIHDYTAVEEILACTTRTATANGTGVDMQQYVGKVKFILVSEIGGGTTPTLDVKLQDSADDATYADIPGATFAQVTDAADVTEAIGVDIDAADRYVRAVSTITGTSPTFETAVVAVGQKQIPGN